MTLPIERSRTRRPVTWLTLIGVILLPVVIGGLLVAALYNPTERLDNLSAAIVNEDQPVTIDEQYVPLGRQLTAGLVEGSDEVASNLTWTISNADDAAEGLADGRYAAVITIPSNFSAAATSTRPGETPEQATIQVQTSPDALIVDDAITAQVTQAAASVMGEQLSQVYLENVFLGFTTLGDQLGEAAAGAQTLADGAAEAADGAAQLPAGATQLADGARGLSTGATALAGGLGQLQKGAQDAASGAGQLATGVRTGASTLEATGIVPADLTKLATGAATATGAAKGSAASTVTALESLAASCTQSTEFCNSLAAAVTSAKTTSGILSGDGTATNPGAAQLTQYAAGGLAQLASEAPKTLAAQLRTIAGNVDGLAGGMSQIAGGVGQSQAGAQQLSSGASQLASGLDEFGTGTQSLADGVAQLATGTTTLADGLATAADQVPTYTDSEAQNLAEVVANPVVADGVGSTLFGASAVPLLATLALWFGGLATFIALRAVSARALTSRAASALLAGRALAPAAGIGALQGLLVAVVVQFAASYEWGAWFVFAGAAIVAGVAFAAVNQALVAVFGGAGRWIAALVGVLAVATGVVSTAPGVLSSIAGIMPTSPAYTAMLAALGPAGGVWAGIVGLLIWAVLAFAATILAVTRRRTTSARALLKASPVTA